MRSRVDALDGRVAATSPAQTAQEEASTGQE